MENVSRWRGMSTNAAAATQETIAALAKATKSPDATAAQHHRLGNLYQDEGKLDRAIVSYRRALKLDSGNAELYNDLGTAYFAKGFLDDAAKNFRLSIARRHEHDIAHANLGAALRRQGKLQDARRAYQAALGIRVRRAIGRWLPFVRARPRPPAAAATGDPAQAQLLAEQRVNANPNDPEALAELAALYLERKYFGAAIEFFGRALTLRPGHLPACMGLGKAYAGLGSAGDAVRCFGNALAIDPGLLEARLQLGYALHQLDRDAEAERNFHAALEQEPGNASALVGLALVQRDQDRLDEAVATVRRVGNLESQQVDVINRAGSVLLSHPDHVDEAIRLFGAALRAAPNPVPPLVNLGLAHQSLGLLEEARRYYRAAQRHEPWSIPANFNESLASLVEGDFARGWEKYHWRTRLGGHKFSFPAFRDRELWDGTPLAGRSLFVHGEQGLGDEIMFASCLPPVVAQAKQCVIGCDARLEKLFRRSFPQATVVGEKPEDRSRWEKTAPPTDLYSPVGSLPAFLRRSGADFPAHQGYLKADPERVRAWQETLASLGGRKIGLSWRGGRTVSWSARRSLSLEKLLPLLSSAGATFVNLQYGERREEVEAFSARHGIRVHDFPEAIDDYDETAALCCALDLTISVCTAVVHLNGALGRPVWVLAPYVPEWRYGMRGTSMPWYPSARVYRQTRLGDWASPLQQVERDLRARLAS
jgi:tetratricopeptide (TPR) repeat protein